MRKYNNHSYLEINERTPELTITFIFIKRGLPSLNLMNYIQLTNSQNTLSYICHKKI